MSLSKEDRERVINSLFHEMCQSSFAEGCEGKIFAGLEAASDDELLAKAKKWYAWTPAEVKV